MKRLLAGALVALAVFGQIQAKRPVRVVLGGDIMLARHVWLTAQQHKDPSWPFQKIASLFREADLSFANLESPFAETGPYFEDRMVFRTHPSMVEGLVTAGIDVVSTANNHSRDAGPRGIEFTLEHLSKHDIAAVGTVRDADEKHKGVIVERRGTRFGFLAYTFDQRNGNHPDDDMRVAMMDPVGVAADIAALRSNCDVVIVSMHAGVEYQPRPNAEQMRFARAAIDAGATIVAGHHPHVFQPAERYKHGVIFYSLGNLVFDQAERPGVKQGAIAEVDFLGDQLAGYLIREVTIRNTMPSL
ncbi:MAG: CapA family protein [Acidobacteria bacterium]|nr:CapA family protein [Acidobacteriota bacterium]